MASSQARSHTAPLLSPEEIAVRAGQQIPFLRLPVRKEVFSARETRLRERAASHSMRDFLLFLAEVSQVQHQLLQSDLAFALPNEAALAEAAHAGQPPLRATGWQRDPRWRDVLHDMLARLAPRLDGNPALAAVHAVQEMHDQELELQADRLLNNIMFGLDMAASPLIAAALQVYWTHMVIATSEAHASSRIQPFCRVADATHCPCCGSLPTASIARIDGDGNYRYLHCSLCATQWHMVRIKCAHCESTKGIHYQMLQPVEQAQASTSAKAAIEAETCDECGHYLKIVRMEQEFSVDPMADDLASVTLDLLVSDAGYQRHGVNLMLLFGDPDDPGNPDTGGGGR